MENLIEFDSLINLRSSQVNFSRGRDNPNLRQKISQIVHQLTEK